MMNGLALWGLAPSFPHSFLGVMRIEGKEYLLERAKHHSHFFAQKYVLTTYLFRV